jgi:LPXTG-motif cell wall-anchored protein
MQLQEINKAIYRKRLNRITLAIIVAMLLLAIGSSSLLIELLGQTGESNFWFNLIGVILAATVVGYSLYRSRHSEYMKEVWYAWQLKQELNRIYRKSAKLTAAVDRNDANALIIMNFNLRGSLQLYELDDNDLTLTELKQQLKEFEAKLTQMDLGISTNDYHTELLNTL